MRLRHMILVALMLVVGNTSLSVQNAVGQTRLGLFVTQEELNIWRQRMVSGPYRVTGDVSANSPGDWTRISANATAFKNSPATYRWTQNVTNRCIANTDPDPQYRGNEHRDAGFYYLLTGDTAYSDAVRSELLSYAAATGLNFSNTTIWCSNLNVQDNPVFDYATWLTRLLFAYDYTKATFSAGQRTTVETWFHNAATYLAGRSDAQTAAHGYFKDRNNGDWTLTGNGTTDANTVSNLASTPIYYGGPNPGLISEAWNNRASVHLAFGCLVGIMTSDAALIAKFKTFFKEALQFATFSDGHYYEYDRWNSGFPQNGYGYASQTISSYAIGIDALARNGDLELYNYSTSNGAGGANGTTSTAGGPKTFRSMITNFMQHTTSIVHYGTDQAGNNGNVNYRAWPQRRSGTSESRLTDTWFAMNNLFWQDASLTAIYRRTAGGAPAYDSTGNLSADVNQYMGASFAFPGALFMFGQMEGVVSPYPGSTVSVPPPSSSSSAPVAYWKFDEGSGTVAQDSSGTGNNASLVNGATWTTGKSGSAISFDGVDDFVKIATTNFSASQGTFSAWVEAPFFKSGEQYIFGHTSLPAYGNRIQLYTGDIGGNLDVGFGDSHTSSLNIQQLQANTWYHLALTWNAGAYAVYIDGVQKTTDSYSGLTSLNSYAHIGGVGYDSAPESWTGVIDEVKAWNRALSATEVQNEYNSYQAPLPAAPLNLSVVVGP